MSVNETARLLGPAAEPPSGVVPNFVDPYSIRFWVVGLGIACSSITSLLVGLRMYIKIFIARHVLLEDYYCLVGWLLFLAYVGSSMVIAFHGGGTHQWDVQLAQLSILNYWSNISEILYGPCIVFVKVSILLQYLRIFVTSRKSTIFYSIHAVLWITILFYLADTIAEITACTPREKIWHPLVPGHCINISAAFIATASANVFTDMAIFLLPMNVIYHLHISKKKKAGIAAVFATGGVACITSIVRLALSVGLLTTPDFTYHEIIAGLFTYAEITLGLTASCLPIIPRLFGHLKHKREKPPLLPAGKRTHGTSSSGTHHALEMKSYRPLDEQEFSQTSTVIERGLQTEMQVGGPMQDGSARERGFGRSEEGIRATTRIEMETHRVSSLEAM